MTNHEQKILIVNDEPNVRWLLHSILNKTFIVLEAEDGRQAIEMVNTEKPDSV